MNTNKNEKEWLIGLVKTRHAQFSLTDKQAEEIHEYEISVVATHSQKHIPSFWEEKEIESYYFKQILNSDQFKIYQNTSSQQIKELEISLAESDKTTFWEVEYFSKLLNLYRNEMVPLIINHKHENSIGILPDLKRRINFLKDECNEYMRFRIKETTVLHFRHYRNFRPNKFKTELLRHEIEKTLPSYHSLEDASGQDVKEIGLYLIKNMTHDFECFKDFSTKLLPIFQRSLEDLDLEFKINFQQGIPIITGHENSTEGLVDEGFLSYLLVDYDKYAWQQ